MPAAPYKENGPDLLNLWESRFYRGGYVYVIQGEPNTSIKVGYASDVAARIASLQTGNPTKLRLLHVIPGDKQLEWFLHRRLKGARIPGSEWFRPGQHTDDFLRFVSDLAERMADAYKWHGEAPSYYDLDPEAFKLPHHKKVHPVEVTYVEPDPRMPKEEADRTREFHARHREIERVEWGRY